MDAVRALSDDNLLLSLEYELKRERDELQHKIMSSANEISDGFLSKECRQWREDLEHVEHQLDFYRKLKLKNKKDDPNSDIMYDPFSHSSHKTAAAASEIGEPADPIDKFEKHLAQMNLDASTDQNTSAEHKILNKISSDFKDLSLNYQPEFVPTVSIDRIIEKENAKHIKEANDREEARRTHELNSLLLLKTSEREAALSKIKRENAEKTRAAISELERTLEVETHDAITSLNQEISTNQQQIAENLRKEFKEKVEATKKSRFNSILRREEEKLMKKTLETKQEAKELEEVEAEKLTKALAIGASKRIATLNSSLEAKLDAKLKALREEAALTLESTISRIKKEYDSTSVESIDDLKEELGRKHEIAVSQLRQSLECSNSTNLHQLVSRMSREKTRVLEAERQRIEAEGELKLGELEKAFQAELTTAVAALEGNLVLEIDTRMAEIHRRNSAVLKKTLAAKQAQFRKSVESVLEKSSRFLKAVVDPSASTSSWQFFSQSKDSASSQSKDDDGDHSSQSKNKELLLPGYFYNTTDAASSLVPNVKKLAGQYNTLHEAHGTLVTRLGSVAQELLRVKRTVVEKDKLINVLQSKLQASEEKQKQTQATSNRLFAANEDLLSKIK